MKIIIIMATILLMSCEKSVDTKISQTISWERHDLIVPGANGSLGGIDVTRAEDGSLHAALIMQTRDSETNLTYFKLFYFYQDDAKWIRKELKSSRAPFHFVYGGNNPNNFVRIIVNHLNEIQIFYVNSMNQLIKLTLGEESVVAEGVRNFTVSYDERLDEYHFVTTGSGDRRDSLSYINSHGSDYYEGSDFTQIDPAHVELLFKDGEPIILTKTAGKFLMIKNGEVIVLVNHERSSSLFNAYWSGEKIKTCGVDIAFVSQGVKIEKTNSISNVNNLAHCLVSEDRDFSIVRFNNYQPYNHALETPGMVYTGLPLLEIKLLRYQGGTIVIAGLDFESGQPVLLLKLE